MTPKSAKLTPEAAAATEPAPLPSEGGSYVRHPDGSLTRRDEAAPVTDTPEKEA